MSDVPPRWHHGARQEPDVPRPYPQPPSGDYPYGYGGDPYPEQHDPQAYPEQQYYQHSHQQEYPQHGYVPQQPQYQQYDGYPGQDGYGGYPDRQGHPGQGHPEQGYQDQGYQGHQDHQDYAYQQPAYYGRPAAAPPAQPRPGPPPGDRPQEPAPRREPAPPLDRDQAPSGFRIPAGQDGTAGTARPDGTPGRQGSVAASPDYRTEQFAFVEETDESDEVIDWLRFTESRTERRDERKRRGRNRVIALVVVAVLALAGGTGYLWQAGLLPGTGAAAAAVTAADGQKRDVIVVNLRPVDSDETSTALLVDNSTTHKGYLVLLPNSLAVSTDDGGSTTLGKSVVDQGAGPTRDALSTLLGTDINGTWRLDTPYLELLVEGLGGITVDTDATIVSGTGGKAQTVVTKGAGQDLSGQAAVAYATYRARGESEDRQLARFAQVMQAVLKKMPSDPGLAVQTVQALNAIPDPSLSDKALGASLAALAEEAKTGAYATETLTPQADGTLGQSATDGIVKNVLGGTVRNTDSTGTPSVSVRNASGDAAKASSAQVAMVNAGYTYVDGGTDPAASATSRITYSAADEKPDAEEVAKTLGLPTTLVVRGAGAANADITVVLGQDYTPADGQG